MVGAIGFKQNQTTSSIIQTLTSASVLIKQHAPDMHPLSATRNTRDLKIPGQKIDIIPIFTMPTPQAKGKKVTVCIVSHGQQNLILPLIEQLNQFCIETISKIVLILNIEETDLVSGRIWDIPMQIKQNSHPKGFGENQNLGFLQCNTEWFLVLNPDIRFKSNVIAQLISEANPKTGLLAPRIQEPGKQQLEPHRSLLTPFEIMRRNSKNYNPPKKPSWIPGLFMLFRSQTFREIGGFDQKYFMYGEDFDICARTRLSGWDIHVSENLTALHMAQRQSHQKSRYFYWHATSLLKLWISKTFWKYKFFKS